MDNFSIPQDEIISFSIITVVVIFLALYQKRWRIDIKMINNKILFSVIFLLIIVYQIKDTNILTYDVAILLFIVLPTIIYFFTKKIFNIRINEK